MTPAEIGKPLEIRDLESLSEMREVEEIQKEVWGIDDREVFPALALIPMREVGAVLIGAFDGDRMSGFVFGFPGIENGQAILHSDMLAVRHEYRSHGLGYTLKLAQRDRALTSGIEIITWTFDPLQSLNAHLNITKLGVISDSYRVNYYGETTSLLHRTGTDRLWVRWLLGSERVRQRIMSSPGVSPMLEELPALVRVGENDEPIVSDEALLRESVIVEIPESINSIFKTNLELASRWREATRRVFTRVMTKGFFVEEFYRGQRLGRRFGSYVLSKKRDVTT